MESTCKTCINNDDGLCDRKGILVEDEDSCEHHWAAGKKVRMKRHEKKMDITPENIYRNSNYCHKCGQALDWEEVNNNEL